jgi:hypothetical protein
MIVIVLLSRLPAELGGNVTVGDRAGSGPTELRAPGRGERGRHHRHDRRSISYRRAAFPRLPRPAGPATTETGTGARSQVPEVGDTPPGRREVELGGQLQAIGRSEAQATVWPGLTTRGTGPPGTCNPEQRAILVTTSPLSSSERWTYEERPPAQTSASDWIGTPRRSPA